LNKKVNKKYYIITVALTLIATMLMVPITNAQTNSLSSIVGSSNVTDPQNIVGTSPDGKYACFNPTEAKLIGALRTSPSTPVTPSIYAYATSTVKVDIYIANDCYGSWNYTGYTYVGTTIDWYTASGSATGLYIGLASHANSGVYLYTDHIV